MGGGLAAGMSAQVTPAQLQIVGGGATDTFGSAMRTATQTGNAGLTQVTAMRARRPSANDA